MSTDESRAANQRSSTRSWRGFSRRAGSSTRSRRGFSRRAKTRTRTRLVVLSPRPTALAGCSLLRDGDFCSLDLLHGGLGITILQFFDQKRKNFCSTVKF